MSSWARGRSTSSTKWSPVDSRETSKSVRIARSLSRPTSPSATAVAGAAVPRAHQGEPRGGRAYGLGVLECDVTFTNDGARLPPRPVRPAHDHQHPRHASCRQGAPVPFSPAIFDASGTRTTAASALCCTSDLTLEEFKSLKGKMDASDPTPRRRGVPRARRTGARICMRPADTAEPQREHPAHQIACASSAPELKG